MTDSSTSPPATTSRRGMYRGGLKKWVIRNLEATSWGIPCVSSERGRVDVLDERIVRWPRCSTRLSYRLRLMSRFSITTSITQSISFSFGRSSSMFPGVIRPALLLCISISGLDFGIRPMAPLAMALLSSASLGKTSSRRTSHPALAQCAAIPAPITPLPMTATFWIDVWGEAALSASTSMLIVFGAIRSPTYIFSRMVAMP